MSETHETMNFDDEERINLALNTDFDSALLNCLEGDEDDRDDDLGGDASDFSHSPGAGPLAGNDGAQMPRLPSFLLNENGANVAAGNDTNGESLGMHRSTSLEDDAMPSIPIAASTSSATSITRGGEPSIPIAGNPNYYENSGGATPQMHPLAISSSASCPPVHNKSNSNLAAQGLQMQQSANNMDMSSLADPSMTAALQAAFASSFMQMSNSNGAYNPALVPLAYNALAAGVDLSNFLPQFQAPVFPMETSQPPQQQQQIVTTHSEKAKPASATPQSSADSKAKPAAKASSKRKRNSQKSSNSKRSKSSGRQASQRQQTPFLLFDAPVELRQNFIQSQRAHGMPVLEDNNSYHFGMTVNGFHPQRSLEEPFFYKSLHSKRPLPDPVPVVDARHADVGGKRLKNAKEQKRAHRISELIDQLRVKMEKGGWNVGIKSKFHTLSSCSDYVRHLIDANKEREAAVQKAKKDLTAKKEQMEEEKRTQLDPSEPESTISSLTVSSRSEKAEKKKSPGEHVDGDSGKKPRHFDSHESNVSSGSSSEDAKQGRPSLSVGATSTVSDMTDPNKGGSYSKASNDKRNVQGEQELDEAVASEAAVVPKTESTSSPHRHEDVVVRAAVKSDSVLSGANISTSTEKTSLDNDFELDYQEVFLKSNVPQLLAATNGRIAAYNDFFHKVSGMSRNQIESLTIFSLVQTSMLSSLFEIVAAALRSKDTESTEGEESNDANDDEQNDSQGERKVTPLKDYAAITLPCIDFSKIFRADHSKKSRNKPAPRQLHMTVTLMTDDDVRKRCFHCAFTDCPGTKGALGSVTPELLSALFTNPADLPAPLSSANEPEETDVDEDMTEDT